MNVNKVEEAAEVLAWFAEQAGSPGEQPADRTQMHCFLTIARSYLLEYALNVHRGLEPYDALMAAVRGDEKLTPQQQDLFRALGVGKASPPGQ